jgi:hypothetical protein
MNLIQQGSPRHEQTVAVALILIIAQSENPLLRSIRGSNR